MNLPISPPGCIGNTTICPLDQLRLAIGESIPNADLALQGCHHVAIVQIGPLSGSVVLGEAGAAGAAMFGHAQLVHVFWKMEIKFGC